MTYEIPKNLNNKRREIFAGITYKQFGYLAVLALIIYVSFQITSSFVGIIIIALVAAAILFPLGFLNMDELILKKINLRNSPKNLGYYDKAMENIIEINGIKDDIVMLTSGEFLSVLEVEPVDVSIMSGEEKELIRTLFQKTMRGLDSRIIITSRSTEVLSNINEWMDHTQKKVDLNEKSTDLHKSLVNDQAEFLKESILKNDTRNRTFYVLIPFARYNRLVDARSFFKTLSYAFKGQYFDPVENNEKEFSKLKKKIHDQISGMQENFEKMGLKTRRLNSNRLLSMFSSYLTGMQDVDMSFVTPYVETNLKDDSFKRFHAEKINGVIDYVSRYVKANKELSVDKALKGLNLEDQKVVKNRLLAKNIHIEGGYFK